MVWASCHGGTWVTTSRLTPAPGRDLAGLLAGEVEARRVVVAGAEGRLAQEQVGVGGDRVQRRGRSGVAAVGEHLAEGTEPQAVRRDGVVDLERLDQERPDRDRLAVDAEGELLAHARLAGQVVGLREPLRRSLRPPDRDPRLGARGVVLAQDVVARHVDAVVGVQVAQEHRVDLAAGRRTAAGDPERAVAQVQHQAPDVRSRVRLGLARGSSSPATPGPGYEPEQPTTVTLTRWSSGWAARRRRVVSGATSSLTRVPCGLSGRHQLGAEEPAPERLELRSGLPVVAKEYGRRAAGRASGRSVARASR